MEMGSCSQQNNPTALYSKKANREADKSRFNHLGVTERFDNRLN
tara:strand:- start:330 stop:461 length:132 start_codon:yes stop_codon:yes gene_type:complete